MEPAVLLYHNAFSASSDRSLRNTGGKAQAHHVRPIRMVRMQVDKRQQDDVKSYATSHTPHLTVNPLCVVALASTNPTNAPPTQPIWYNGTTECLQIAKPTYPEQKHVGESIWPGKQSPKVASY